MFTRIFGLAGILSIALLAGCIDATTLLFVKKDGSGLVVETVYMGKALEQMMQQMAAGFGGETAKQAGPKELPLEIEKYKAKAKKMGEGVKFVSAKRVTKADGSPGVRVVYSFPDVRKLTVSEDPDTPSSPGGGPGMMNAGQEKKKKKNPIRFDFVKGASPKLIIKMPEAAAAKDATASPESLKAPAEMPSASPTPEQMAMMKQMFGDFRMRIMVKVDGEITDSNASHVQKDGKSGKKCLVTLLDMNIGELLANEEQFKKLAAMGKIEDMSTAKYKLKDISGLKIEPEEKIEVVFH
jgi:hypothetical protein